MRLFKLHKPETVGHILAVRLTDLGQTAMVAHSIRGLRAAYPSLRITVLTDARFVPLFAHIDDLHFVAVDVRKCSRNLLYFWCLRRAVRHSDAEAAADLECSRLSRRLLFSLKPWRRRRAVINLGKLEKELMTRKFRKVVVKIDSTTVRAAATFARLGFEFPLPPPISRRAEQSSSALTILAGEKRGLWVGVAPFSKHKGKCYTIPQTDALVELLLKSCHRVFIIGEGRYEAQFGEGMERRRRGVVSLVDRVDLADELEAFAALDAIVTVDNPVLRLASLVGTPVVSVWGATHHFIDSCGYGQNPDYAIGLEMECRPCSVAGEASCLFGHYQCMRRIAPERIADAVGSLLNARAADTAVR